jgi:hypothetical protein
MKQNNIELEKRRYNAPQLMLVKLDNAISLELESEPPTFESSNLGNAPDYFNNDPLKTNYT